MSRQPELRHCKQQLATHFHGISPVFIALVALWSFGMTLARRCGLDGVANHLAPLLGQPFNTARQRLREFYQEAAAKAGAKRGLKRKDFAVVDCFPLLLAWVLSFWPCKRLALALDVTNLAGRFHVLCVSGVYGGIGVPVAWTILVGNEKEAWHPHWCELLKCLQPAPGPGWAVVVLSDRGLGSSRLFNEVVGVGWHPPMRVKGGGKFRPSGWHNWYAFKDLAPRVGCRFAAAGLAYKGAECRLACTLLACWDVGHAEPWLLLTDLPAGSATPLWYAFGSWIEQGFKVVKSGALQWQSGRMDKPQRAERLGLAIAVALLWLVVIGAAVESASRKGTIAELPEVGQEKGWGVKRRQRLFVLGLAEWLAAPLSGRPLPMGKLAPQPWPDTWHDVPTLTERDFLAQQTYP
jgi:hypothetical protein